MPAFAKKERNKDVFGDGPSMIGSPAGTIGAAPTTPAVGASIAAPAPPAAAAEIDLLQDILGGAGSSPAAQPVGGGMPAAPPPGVGGGTVDLLGLLGSPAPAGPPSTPPAAMGGLGGMDAMIGMSMGISPPGSFAPFTVWNKNGMTIEFVCTKDSSNASITNIVASFTNGTGAPFDGLNFQVAVPKYMQLKMTPPSSPSVPPSNSGKTKQQFKVANSMHGHKPVILRVKIEYTTMGQLISETGQVDNFPPGV